MPAGIRERNSVLAAAALVYFTRVHSGRIFPRFRSALPSRLFAPIPSSLLSKELLVGGLFTAGCVLPAWSRNVIQTGSAPWPLFATALLFATLAWLNCHAIERWESRHSQPLNSNIYVAASLLALAGLFLAAVLLPMHPGLAALTASGAASALLLALLHHLRHRLTPLALRAAADLALLTPALIAPLVPVLK
jgi:hypothetical protein